MPPTPPATAREEKECTEEKREARADHKAFFPVTIRTLTGGAGCGREFCRRKGKLAAGQGDIRLKLKNPAVQNAEPVLQSDSRGVDGGLRDFVCQLAAPSRHVYELIGKLLATGDEGVYFVLGSWHRDRLALPIGSRGDDYRRS